MGYQPRLINRQKTSVCPSRVFQNIFIRTSSLASPSCRYGSHKPRVFDGMHTSQRSKHGSHNTMFACQEEGRGRDLAFKGTLPLRCFETEHSKLTSGCLFSSHYCIQAELSEDLISIDGICRNI
jgi:hypothetical protein